MGPIGSPTLRAHTMLQNNVSSIRERLDSVRTEAVTGRASDIGRAVGGDTAKVNRLSESIAYAEDRSRVLGFEGNRAKTIQSSFNDVRVKIDKAQNAAILGLSEMAPEALGLAASLGESGFSDAVHRFNGKFAGRLMFGGDSGTAPLVDADSMMSALRAVVSAAPDTATALSQINAYFDDPAGGFATTAFQGGAGDAPAVELSTDERVSTAVRADEQAVRDTLKSLALIALSGDEDTIGDKRAFLSAGNSTAGSAIEGVVGLQASLGVREERIAIAQSSYQGEIATLGIAMNDLTGRDQAEAATEMRLLESQLEAAYLTTSRLAGLSLTNFLR